MKAHELAEELLKGPNWDVYVQDGSYASTWEKVGYVTEDANKQRIELGAE